MAKRKKGPKKGLSPKTFQGLNKKRMEKKGGNFKRLVLKQGDSATVQFLDPIGDFLEYDNHSWRDSGGWNYVPCAGNDCPLCEDEDDNVSKTSYRFCANAYIFKEKKVLIVEGPKDLAGRIALRYKTATKNGRRPEQFSKRVYEVSKFPTTPVSYDVESVEREDQRPVNIDGLERHDLLQYVTDEMISYFGDDIPTSSDSGPSALDDDWDDDDEDEFDDEDAYTEKELRKMGPSELKEAARDVGIKVKKVTSDNRKKLISAILRKQ